MARTYSVVVLLLSTSCTPTWNINFALEDRAARARIEEIVTAVNQLDQRLVALEGVDHAATHRPKHHATDP